MQYLWCLVVVLCTGGSAICQDSNTEPKFYRVEVSELAISSAVELTEDFGEILRDLPELRRKGEITLQEKLRFSAC